MLLNLFGYDKVEPKLNHRNKDYGLFAAAYATSIAFGKDPNEKIFYQEKLRTHLVDSLQKDVLSFICCK